MSDTEEYPIIDVFIEIQKHSNVKYEYDNVRNLLVCDRIIPEPFQYIFNYGFIPNTLSEDNDPLDVVLLMNESLLPGCIIKCKIIGCLIMVDQQENDPKIIAVPLKKVDPNAENINDICDISTTNKNNIKYFFSHYKDLEYKKVEVSEFVDKSFAIDIYENSCKRYNENLPELKSVYF
jgi:inorganic pyrophosphatase